MEDRKTITTKYVSTSITVIGQRMLTELSEKTGLKKGSILEFALKLYAKKLDDEGDICQHTKENA